MNVLEEYLHNAYFRVQQDIIGGEENGRRDAAFY
jgi:hypothetical protein